LLLDAVIVAIIALFALENNCVWWLLLAAVVIVAIIALFALTHNCVWWLLLADAVVVVVAKIALFVVVAAARK
jgi:hypothetical protein